MRFPMRWPPVFTHVCRFQGTVGPVRIGHRDADELFHQHHTSGGSGSERYATGGSRAPRS